MRKIISLGIVLLMMCMVVSNVSAHVVVRPAEVGVGAFQTFTVGVPVEQNQPTVGLRLMIPEGLNHVTPNVKQGWTVDIQKSGEGEDALVTEISWTGGSIPAGQRDDFLFSAQVPAEEAEIMWKAYQTYADGSVVAWDQSPDQVSDDFSEKGPYSKTSVINDLAANDTHHEGESSNSKDGNNLPLALSVIAVIVSGTSLWMQMRKK